MEGDGLHGAISRLFVSNDAFVVVFFPFGGNIKGAIEHLPMNIVAWRTLCLWFDLIGSLGTYFHAETVFVTSTPDMIWGVDKQLSVPNLLWIVF